MVDVAQNPDANREVPARLARTEQLVESAQRGEPGSLDALVRGHLDDLRGFVRLHLSPALRVHESCSDIVQSVCREVVEDLAGFDYRGPSSFRAWLFTAALNKIRQKHAFWHAQKRDISREISTDGASDDGDRLDPGVYASLCAIEPTPSEHAIAHEQARRIEQAIDRLTPEQREVLLLARFAGLGHGEIAERVGRSELAVRSLLSRAGVQLLAMLERRK